MSAFLCGLLLAGAGGLVAGLAIANALGLIDAPVLEGPKETSRAR